MKDQVSRLLHRYQFRSNDSRDTGFSYRFSVTILLLDEYLFHFKSQHPVDTTGVSRDRRNCQLFIKTENRTRLSNVPNPSISPYFDVDELRNTV